MTYLEDDEGNKKKGYANGTFKVNNNNTLDYEEYEILYLKIQAQDIKQEEGNGFDNCNIIIYFNIIKPLFNLCHT